MNDHSRGLVEDSEELVFKENFHRHLLSAAPIRTHRRRFAPEDLVTDPHDFRCFGQRAIEKHLPGSDYGLNSRPGNLRQQSCQTAI